MASKRADAVERGKFLDKKPEGSSVYKVDPKLKRRPFNRQPDVRGRQCDKCGYDVHKGEKALCPATNRDCAICKKTGHFAKMCRQKEKTPVKKVDRKPANDSDTDTEDSDGYQCFKIEVLQVGGKETTRMRIDTNGHEVHWQPDTGTQKDIWDINHLRRYESMTGLKVELEKAGIPLYPYGSNQCLNVKGKFAATLRVGDRTIDTDIYVTEERSKYPLVSEDSAIALGLVQYNDENVVKAVQNKREISKTGGDCDGVSRSVLGEYW